MKRSAMLVLGVALTGFLQRANAAPVVGPNGNSYEVIPAAGITWPDADAAATALGGHLATSTSPTENSFIDALRTSAGLGEVWLGGYQDPITESVPTAGWTWVNGEGTFPGVSSVSRYATWLGGEPNDAYGLASEQYLGIGLGGSAAWNDEGALGLITGYVVEYNATSVPEGGSLSAVFGGAIVGLMLCAKLKSGNQKS